MTETEKKILQRLNTQKGDPNATDEVIHRELGLILNETISAINSLCEKKFIYEESNANQKNLKVRAWKINPSGEAKINELQKKMKLSDEKPKFKLEFGHKLTLISILIAIIVLLFGNNLYEKITQTEDLTTNTNPTILIQPETISISRNSPPSKLQTIFTLPCNNLKQKDSILSSIHNEKKLRPLTILESGKTIENSPNNSYFYVSVFYLNMNSKYETFAELMKARTDRLTKVPYTTYEVHKISNDEVYIVGFVSQETASNISAIKDEFVFTEELLSNTDILTLIPLNLIVNSKERRIQINKDQEMIVLDIRLKN